MKPVQLLQRLQSHNSPSILNTIAKERRQDLNLLSGKVLGRQGPDHSSEIRNGFPPQDRIFVVDVFAQRLHDIDQGRFSSFDVCSMTSLLEHNNAFTTSFH